MSLFPELPAHTFSELLTAFGSADFFFLSIFYFFGFFSFFGVWPKDDFPLVTLLFGAYTIDSAHGGINASSGYI